MRYGIDLGGTKMEIVGLDGSAIVYRKRIPSPQQDYEKTLRAITLLFEQAIAETGQRGTLGIGIPGTISPATRLVKNANSTWLIGHPIDRDLEARIGQPVRIANDANCFTLSEAADGAGSEAHTVFGVIVGTGCGGGLTFDSQIWTGPNAIAGEWGHSPLPWKCDEDGPSRNCYCGKQDCIETYLCGSGLSLTHEQRTDQRLLPEQVSISSPDTMAIYCRQMAKSLASVINVIDPDVIVLGGGLSNIMELYKTVPSFWGSYAFSDKLVTKLVRNSHGDSSGVRGAAWLWPDV